MAVKDTFINGWHIPVDVHPYDPVKGPGVGRRRLAYAIDAQCVAAGALTGAKTGSTWVQLAFDATYTPAVGNRLAVGATAAALKAVVGVVRWDQGTKAAGDLVWVRIYGLHPYALLDGSGTNVALNDPLMAAASGKAVVLTNAGFPIAVAAVAATVTTDSYGQAWVMDPLGLAAGLI